MEPAQSPRGGSGTKPPEALTILHFTVPKETEKTLSWCNFIALDRKNSRPFISILFMGVQLYYVQLLLCPRMLFLGSSRASDHFLSFWYNQDYCKSAP